MLPAGEVGEIPGAVFTKSYELNLLRGNGVEILGTEASRESGVASVDARARAVDDDGFRYAGRGEDRRPLDGGPAAKADIGFPIGARSLAARSPERTRQEAGLGIGADRAH